MTTASATPLTATISYKPMAMTWGVMRTSLVSGLPANDSTVSAPGRTATAYTCTSRQSAVLIFSINQERMGDYPHDLSDVLGSLLVGREETLSVFAQLAGERLARRWAAGSAISFMSSDANMKLYVADVRIAFAVI